jgi:hypothetical protein
MIGRHLLAVMVFLVTPFLLYSQNEAGKEVIYPIAKKKTKRSERFVAFPVVVKSPEYLWGAGGAGTYFFRVGKDSLTRTSSFKAVTFATLRKQAVVACEGYVFFPGEHFILYINTSTSRFPDKFWGLGNETPSSNLEKYAISQYNVSTRLNRKLFSDFYAGIGYDFQNVFKFDYDHSGASLFDLENIVGRDGGKVSGAGYLLAWDSRNDAFSPAKGFYIQYYHGFFGKKIGSDFNFKTFTLDVRKYFRLKKEVVLAFQGNFIGSKGNVPVRNLSNIGSNSYMRGYYEGRYTDKDLLAFQSEVRYKVYKRFGMATFGGLGKVAGRFADLLNFRNLKPSYGLGIRYALKPKEKLNLRVDSGFGKKSHGSYINLGEAF